MGPRTPFFSPGYHPVRIEATKRCLKRTQIASFASDPGPIFERPFPNPDGFDFAGGQAHTARLRVTWLGPIAAVTAESVWTGS
jgi:hypothetical protein